MGFAAGMVAAGDLGASACEKYAVEEGRAAGWGSLFKEIGTEYGYGFGNK